MSFSKMEIDHLKYKKTSFKSEWFSALKDVTKKVMCVGLKL